MYGFLEGKRLELFKIIFYFSMATSYYTGKEFATCWMASASRPQFWTLTWHFGPREQNFLHSIQCDLIVRIRKGATLRFGGGEYHLFHWYVHLNNQNALFHQLLGHILAMVWVLYKINKNERTVHYFDSVNGGTPSQFSRKGKF